MTVAARRTEEDHPTTYRVETDEGTVTPDAFADLGDHDNYEHLCLSGAAIPVRVHAAPGAVLDPRRDPNVETKVDISR